MITTEERCRELEEKLFERNVDLMAMTSMYNDARERLVAVEKTVIDLRRIVKSIQHHE